MTKRGLLLRGLALLVAAALVVMAMLAIEPLQRMLSGSAEEPPPPRRPTRQPTSSASAAADGFRRDLDELEFAVVKIESINTDGAHSLGSGFIIDGSGLVATNYHVINEAMKAQVRFRDGSAHQIVGYAAVQPENDLAILKLQTTPPSMTVMRLGSEKDPNRLAPIVAIGHPRGLDFSPYDGKVSRVLKSSQLPAPSREFLRRFLRGQGDPTWIQHTAQISEGNSGGPLLDDSGKVIGVNTWVDRRSKFGYALHIRHLLALKEHGGRPIEPLGAHARRDARVANLLRDLTAERARELHELAESFQFHPEGEREYAILQQLAWAVTASNLPGSFGADGPLQDQLEKLGAATDRITAKLRKRQWGGPGQIIVINEFAAAQASRRLAGVFFFGTMERIVRGADGARGALVRISGLDQTLFIPLEGNLFTADPGDSLLVLGVNYNGRSVQYGENPLNLRTAPVIASRTLISLE